VSSPPAVTTSALTEIVTVVKRNPSVSVALRPPRLVTTTSTNPPPWSGAITLIVEEVFGERIRAATPPMVTVAPALNPAPAMRTVSPDLAKAGTTLVTARSAKVKAPGRLELLPSGLVTITATTPALWTGVVAVMVVLLTTTTSVAAPSMVTVAPGRNLEPSMRMLLAPSAAPALGLTDFTAGPRKFDGPTGVGVPSSQAALNIVPATNANAQAIRIER